MVLGANLKSVDFIKDPIDEITQRKSNHSETSAPACIDFDLGKESRGDDRTKEMTKTDVSRLSSSIKYVISCLTRRSAAEAAA